MNIKITLLIGLLCLTSCIKFDLSKTPHPEQACIYLTTEWGKRTADAPIPNLRVVDVGPAHAEFTGTPAEHALPLLNEGGYLLRVYTPAEKISVQGDLATIATDADGYMAPTPGWLFTSTQSVNVKKDADQHLTAPMVQQVRPVKLTLHAQESDTAFIASVTTVMDGLAGTLNMATGELGTTAAKTTFAFLKPAEPVTKADTKAMPAMPQAEGKVLYADAYIRLLGIVTSAKQTITLKVTFKDGSSALIESDLTEKMASFNKADKYITLELDAEIDVQKTEAGFTAVIGAWDAYKNEIIAD